MYACADRLLLVIFCCVAIFAAPAKAQSGRVEQGCDTKAAAHYADKGTVFMGSQDWTDALFAFQAALDSQEKCAPGTSDGVWGYWANVEMAAAFYNLHNYASALQLLSKADTWYASINLAGESEQNKKAYTTAKELAESIRSRIAAAASRPAVPVAPAAPSEHYSGSSEESTEGLPSGTVSVTRSSCDYFIVDAVGGYDLLEWYGGWTPDRGDEVVGSFETYGFHDIYDKTANHSTRVWVEEYWLSLDNAYDKLNEKCR